MKTVFQKIAVGSSAALVFVLGTVSLAAADITELATLEVNTADVETVMGIIVVGLAALWGFRKIIKTMNRS